MDTPEQTPDPELIVKPGRIPFTIEISVLNGPFVLSLPGIEAFILELRKIKNMFKNGPRKPKDKKRRHF